MESKQTTLPGRLAVVLKNVRAVSEVYDYIHGGLMEEDLTGAREALIRHLPGALQIPNGWRRPYLDNGIWLHPDKKWNVPSKEPIAIAVFLPNPVAKREDEDPVPSVNLWVPSWKLREQFTDSLRPIVPRAEDWVYIRDCEPGEVNPECPLGKWVRYEDYSDPTGFDTARFFQAITGAVNELLQLETEIDRLIEKAKATSVAAPPRQTGGQTRRKPKRR